MTVQDRTIFRGDADTDLFTGASTAGWSGSLNHQTTAGSWSKQEKSLHINTVELKALLFAIKTFTHELKGKTIKVYYDNTRLLLM